MPRRGTRAAEAEARGRPQRRHLDQGSRPADETVRLGGQGRAVARRVPVRRHRPDRHLQRRLGGGQGKKQDGGRALTTRNVSMAAAYERANARCDSSNSPFARCRWRTNGGGRGWMQKEMSMGLHFGEASLQVVHRDFSQMREDTGDCRLRDCPIKPQSTELSPRCPSTRTTADADASSPRPPPAPARRRRSRRPKSGRRRRRRRSRTDTTLAATRNRRAAARRTAASSRSGPMPLAMHETREVVSPAAPFLAAIGADAAAGRSSSASSSSTWCSSGRTLGRLRARPLRRRRERGAQGRGGDPRAVSGEPSGLEKNKVCTDSARARHRRASRSAPRRPHPVVLP